MSQRTSGHRGLFNRAEHEVKLSDDEIVLDTPYIRAMAHVNNKFERKTKTEFSFPRRLNFLPLADGSRSFHDCEMLLLRDC